MFNFVVIFYSIFTAFAITAFFIPIFIKAALAFNIVDAPDGALKRHERVTPYLGGAALFCGFLVSLAFFAPMRSGFIYFILGCVGLVLLGLLDDIYVFSPLTKISGQFIAALLFVLSGAALNFSFLPLWFNLAATVFWYLSVINAFNLVDIMDGLCAVIGLCVTFALLIYALAQSNFFVIAILSSLFGALFAFFLYNKPPAKIYLGDSGSMLVGGVLAYSSSAIQWPGDYFSFFMPLLALGFVIFELCSLVVVRSYKGIPFFRGSPDHFYHYLSKKQFTKHQILLFSLICCFYFFAVSLLTFFVAIPVCVMLLFVAFFVAFWLKTLFF